MQRYWMQQEEAFKKVEDTIDDLRGITEYCWMYITVRYTLQITSIFHLPVKTCCPTVPVAGTGSRMQREMFHSNIVTWRERDVGLVVAG